MDSPSLDSVRKFTKILSEMKIDLFPAKAKADSEFALIHDATFQHWRKIWQSILKLPANSPLNSDNFLRQENICALSFQGEVVGMIANSFFPLRLSAYQDHSYLREFSLEKLHSAASDSKGLAMSIEYLSVDERFRKNELGVSLGSILLGISMEMFRSSPAAVVLGTARSKIHVDEMCYKFGFSPCGEMEKFGHPCTLILNTKATLREHDDLTVRRSVRALWQNRVDFSDSKQQSQQNVA